MGIFVFIIFVACAIYVQTRGRIKHEKWSRRLTDHANFLAPINCLIYAFSKDRPDPYGNLDDFPELQAITDNWQMIRDEAIQLNQAQQIKASEKLDDIGFNSFFKTGWKRYYLKWYGSTLESANQSCPETVALLNSISSVKGAMFAMLPPGARLVKHRDPYAGSLRYHLGLITPNSPDCFINVDGRDYYWKDGEAVMFDETLIHYAENKADSNRIVLFLDIKRRYSFFLIDWLNQLFSYTFMAASATKNVDGDKVGLLNKLFLPLYQIRIIGKRIKAVSIPLYYGLQLVIYLTLIYLLFF